MLLPEILVYPIKHRVGFPGCHNISVAMMKLIPSPCISLCTIRNDVCVGCHRTRKEIARWPRMNEEEKKAAMDRINRNDTGQDTSPS